MHTEHSATVLLALAIVAHAWTGRIVGPPALLSAIGWALNVLLAVLIALVFAGRP